MTAPIDALLPAYARAPVTFVAGRGCELIDDAGRRYLDFLGGLAVCALGHAHPAIARAVARQARTLVHASNLYGHEPAATLARDLATRAGMRGVFFCNSGTEANEAAIKLARKLAFRRGDTRRTTIVACDAAFHGRTLGALAATANPAYRQGFGALPDGFVFTPFNDVPALETAIDESSAAFLVEPVQGEGGVRVADPQFLKRARQLCDERGALLIFDEVQCGAGRLGPFYAFDSFGVKPDVVTIAKALANGLPIGAIVTAERAASGFEPGDHGSTFGGSPIPCAAALAHLQVRDALDLERRVLERSAQLFDALNDLAARFVQAFDAPRGRGLLVGLPVRQPFAASDFCAAARDVGLVVGTAGDNVLRFAPPLVISRQDIARAVRALSRATLTVTQRRS